MGEEGSKHVFERVADVLARLGGDPRGARPRSGDREPGTYTVPASGAGGDDPSNDGEPGRAVTDGGANDAPPGDVPWADDDPIVFGEADDADPGAAILDAVTDHEAAAAPPFGDDHATANAQSGSTADASATDTATDADAVDPERIDELEARLDALEGDHVQLETRLADVARGVANLQEELSATGEDVRLLVAALGGIAIAREGDGGSTDGATDLAATLGDVDADELEAALGSHSEHGEDQGEGGAEEGEHGAAVADAESPDDEDPGAETTRDDEVAFDDEAPPEGIHRGAGEPPSPPTEDDVDSHSDRPAQEETQAAADEAADRTTDGPARELVDPRTDAVGARLRQFREGFVDDPTEDLPTTSGADEFRFEKVLLPTDGEEAPDLSNAELEKPYLEALPDGYAADAVVLEWLDWLVSAADGEAAAQAVVYYESIDWLTEEVRDDLLAYLDGLEETPRREPAGTKGDGVVEPPAALDLQDHLRSLQYVTELASGEVGSDGI